MDSLIRYRIPKEKEQILKVIDILSKNIKCTEIEDRHCKSAIESALKLVDRSIDAKSTNESIKLAVSLALSIGKTSKISDEVLNKIEGDKAFSEIIEMASSMLKLDDCKNTDNDIRGSVIALIDKVSKISGRSYKPSDENGVTALTNMVEYLLKLGELKLRYAEQTEELENAINNILYKCISDNCIVKGIKLLVASGKAGVISDSTIRSIKKIDVFKEILKSTVMYSEKSIYEVNDKFALKIASTCGISCVGYSMEILYKKTDLSSLGVLVNRNMKALGEESVLARLINDLLHKIASQSDSEDPFFSDSKGEGSSIFETIHHYVKKEADLYSKTLKADCINNVKADFHDVFYGDKTTPPEFLEYFKRGIISCYSEIKQDDHLDNTDGDLTDFQT